MGLWARHLMSRLGSGPAHCPAPQQTFFPAPSPSVNRQYDVCPGHWPRCLCLRFYGSPESRLTSSQSFTLVSSVTPWTVACQAPLSMGFSGILKWVAIPISRASS